MQNHHLHTHTTDTMRIRLKADGVPILVDIWRSPIFGLLAQACNPDMTEITDPKLSATADAIAQQALESARNSTQTNRQQEAA